ncbi:CRISPR-associated protein Csx14 [Geoglobus sp.]
MEVFGMKVAVIAPLGMSPPVVTAFVNHVGNVRDLVVITTSDERVKQGFSLVETAMRVRYPRTRVHEVEVPFEDITTEEQNFEFMRVAGRVIRRQKEKFGSDVVYLNVAGGRKNMCITLAILGQFLNVDGVFHVVSPDVKVVNEMLENLRQDIERIHRAESEEERLRIYGEKARYFDALMFPGDYRVVRIPTVPIPGDHMQRLLDILYNDKLDSLTYSERELLLRHGLIEKYGSRYRVTEFGKRFAEVLIR